MVGTGIGVAMIVILLRRWGGGCECGGIVVKGYITDGGVELCC